MNLEDNTIEALKKLLASSYTLYLKTQNYHWNVTGPMFTTLHTLFETQYQDLALAVDEIAERIRALGAHAPGSFSAFAALSIVKEDHSVPDATTMLQHLINDQGLIVSVAQQLIERAESEKDVVTADLATRRIEIHQKNAWMLRSHLD